MALEQPARLELGALRSRSTSGRGSIALDLSPVAKVALISRSVAAIVAAAPLSGPFTVLIASAPKCPSRYCWTKATP